MQLGKMAGTGVGTDDLIVGDFDSSVCPDIDCERIQLVPEKDDTDTMHA